MGKVGFFGASFDPITYSHLWTANHIADLVGLDRVIMGPCSNKRPDKKMKISDEHRWNMLQLAIASNPRFVADDYEMNQQASEVFTYFTMEHYKAKFPQDEIYFMMGADLLVDIAKGQWEYGEELVASNKFIVMSRNDIPMQDVIYDSAFLRPYAKQSRFLLFEKGMDMEISSSFIRSEIANNHDVNYLLPDAVLSYILKHGLYK